MPAAISFEVFPPRTPEAELYLWRTLERLEPLQPSFISVTCGAGGGARDATFGLVEEILARTSLPTAGHLTCVGRDRVQIDAEISRYWDAGVRHIVALRGDTPGGIGRFEPHPDGYQSSIELIAAVRALGPFEVSVAAYPEPHPESVSEAEDLAVLARKADAGATRAISQFCFDADAIVRLRERIDESGIPLTLVPGIMLVTDFVGIARFAARNGAGIPDWLGKRFSGLEDDPEARKLAGAIVAAEQVERLRREGFEDFHFYTLNRSGDLATALCRLLGAGPISQQVGAI